MSAARARGPLVLIADGLANAREQYAVDLVAGGFKVLEAVDGLAAIEKALRFGPHAIVLDLVLPGADGFEVARRLRGEPTTSDVAILAVADLPVETTEPTAIAAGCDAYMSKPLLGAALVGEIVRLLGARRAAADHHPDRR
jgi:DNA-binding response OmpR family regulator